MSVVVRDVDGRRIGLPPAVTARLVLAASAREVCQVVREEEATLALLCPALQRLGGPGPSPYLWCDQAADLVSDLLRAKGLAHETVVGDCDEGSSHAWVRANGENLDPTDQGFGDGSFKVCASYGGTR